MSKNNEQWDFSQMNWPLMAILLTTIGFWTSVWYNGFFVSLMSLIVVSALSLLYLRLTGRI